LTMFIRLPPMPITGGVYCDCGPRPSCAGIPLYSSYLYVHT
jgi:hypothetical protein